MPNALRDFHSNSSNRLLGLGSIPMERSFSPGWQGQFIDPQMLAIKRAWAAMEAKRRAEEAALRMEALRKQLMSADALKDPEVLRQAQIDALRRKELLSGISR